MNVSTIQAVIFDMDGVLTDSEPLINAAAVAMFREKGLEVDPEAFTAFVGTGEDGAIGGVAENYGLDINLADAKRRTYEIYLDLLPDRLKAFPGAVELVHECRRGGLKIALASSADEIKIQANLDHIGLPSDMWDAIVTGDDAANKKPGPDLFLRVAEKLALAPDQCVVIEDAVNGVQAAKSAGMSCVAVAQTFSREDLGEADLVRETISDISSDDICAVPHDGALSQAAPTSLTSRRLVWGFWATMGWGAIIAFAVTMWQIGVGILVVIVMAASGKNIGLAGLEENGLLLEIVTCASVPVVLGLVWGMVWFRRGASLKDYLSLRGAALPSCLTWLGFLVLFIILSDSLTFILGRPVVPDFMVKVYETAGFLPLLWITFMVAAPVCEEVLFRGFLFEGFKRSIGGAGAIVLTSLLWAVIHLQYDLYGIGTIFCGGILLGLVRLKTSSLYLCVFLHGFMNLVATIEVTIYMEWMAR